MISRYIHVYAEKKVLVKPYFPKLTKGLEVKKGGKRSVVFSFFELFHLVYFEGIWCELIMLHFGNVFG